MRNVAPSRALSNRSQSWLLFAVFLLVFGILAIIVSLFLQTVPLVDPDSSDFGFYTFVQTALIWLGFIFITIAVLMGIRALTWRKDNPLAAQVGEVLENQLNLDDRYSYIRNVSKVTIGYIDAVLVGPPGVLVVRVVQKAGTFFNEGSKWLKQKDKGEWAIHNPSPSEEVVQDIKNTREYLGARGLSQIPIFGVVIFTESKPATRVTTQNPVVPVLQPDELAYGLEDSYFAQRDRLDQLTANKVAEALYL